MFSLTEYFTISRQLIRETGGLAYVPSLTLISATQFALKVGSPMSSLELQRYRTLSDCVSVHSFITKCVRIRHIGPWPLGVNYLV